MTLLIAEISNHHQGDMMKAKELIVTAQECGADAVKGQAFIASDMVQCGTMPLSFYEKCSFKYKEYKELIEFGDMIGIPVFFTIISGRFGTLSTLQKYKKIHAKAFAKRPISRTRDADNLIISSCGYKVGMEKFQKAMVLYASVYLKNHKSFVYEDMVRKMGKPLGLSHHGQGITGLLDMISKYDIPVIEKHFFLGDRIEYQGQVYRDCLHSANPKMFELLAKEYKRSHDAVCNM